MLQVSKQGAPAFLASVTNAAEAEIALANGADLIDAKNPSQGALGALAPDVIRAIVTSVDGRAMVSATIGDLPSNPAVMCAAATTAAGAGATLVKVGFFGSNSHKEAIAALGILDLGPAQLAGVLMADQNPDFGLIEAMARAGFVAVVLDTANKARGRLRNVLGDAELSEFLGVARAQGLVSGLAGSLSESDIAPLARLGPDVLGFRGALCGAGRTGPIDGARVSAVNAALAAVRSTITALVPAPVLERSVA